MLSGRAESGHASMLGSLSVAMDLKDFGVQGDGCLRIDEGCQPPNMTWDQNRHGGLTFLSQDEDKVDETFRAMARFSAETVALSGASNQTFDADSNENLHGTRIKDDAYRSRMKFLQDEAEHDGYGLNLASEVDFRQFVQSAPSVRRGNLVLMDNGNLRAIWKDDQGARLGLQFLGGSIVQYVIFKRRSQGQPISRVTGRDSLEGLERQIDAFELDSLLYD